MIMLTSMASAAAAVYLAVVTQNQVPLRAAPKDTAPQQAVLWQGDSLELRGEKLDYLQVYDHRRERAGFVKASQVRPLALDAASAPELLAVVRFLRDTPGAEALGIAYAAAFLKAAPADAIHAEVFDALGSMASRLAQRASASLAPRSAAEVAAHIDVVANYGVTMNSYEHDGHVQLCYDGDAFRRVLAMAPTPAQQATAALALTRPECLDPALRIDQHDAADLQRAEVLDKVALRDLPEHVRNRIHLRRAAVWASIAFERARKQLSAQEAAQRALTELADVNQRALAEEDVAAYSEAAVRVGSVRWAASPAPAAPADTGVRLVSKPGQAGETCVALVDAKHDAMHALASRCTYGIVWPASVSINAQGSALTLAVQPMDGWREMWLFHQSGGAWLVDILPPAASDPDIGYAEFAGWVPGNANLLVVREARIDGKMKRRFEVVNAATLAVEHWSEQPGSLLPFIRWQDPTWKRNTVSLR